MECLIVILGSRVRFPAVPEFITCVGQGRGLGNTEFSSVASQQLLHSHTEEGNGKPLLDHLPRTYMNRSQSEKRMEEGSCSYGPDLSSGINATYISDTEITLTWDLPEGEYNAFEVQYLNAEDVLIQNLTLHNSITLSDLKPHRNYTFTVVVRSGTESQVLRRSLPVSAIFTTMESVPGKTQVFEVVQPRLALCPSNVILDLITLMIFDEECNLSSFSSIPSRLPSWVHIFSSAPCSQTPLICVLPLTRELRRGSSWQLLLKDPERSTFGPIAELSSGQNAGLVILGSRVRFPAVPELCWARPPWHPNNYSIHTQKKAMANHFWIICQEPNLAPSPHEVRQTNFLKKSSFDAWLDWGKPRPQTLGLDQATATLQKGERFGGTVTSERLLAALQVAVIVFIAIDWRSAKGRGHVRDAGVGEKSVFPKFKGVDWSYLAQDKVQWSVQLTIYEITSITGFALYLWVDPASCQRGYLGTFSRETINRSHSGNACSHSSESFVFSSAI
ncbi:Tyrosine-protein phosphatase 10D [Zootermopsis nevadensis]|uniref:Tyrosine-protein phosphatase 10D n=1 Tax=Zootermopsis nevadensis TaxID=136037 RepID=A0A067QXT6_ZOONE|nr:Tyrosine-protein phosphatase 10D [Zootermopsis nevadensis]